MKYAILLDGMELGRLGSGQTLRFSVEEGTHTLSLKPYPGLMVQNFGPYRVVVGKQDVNVWVDTSQAPFVCKITGSANESRFGAEKERMCRRLMELTGEAAGRNLPCYYTMEEDRVILKKNSARKLEQIAYGELSDYAVKTLEPFERVEFAEEFGVTLALSGRLDHVWIHTAGACVNLDTK